jgi:putative FmdB family regulatory protein
VKEETVTGDLEPSTQRESIAAGSASNPTPLGDPKSLADSSLDDSRIEVAPAGRAVPKESALMPIFEYICKECDHQFEALVYGKDKASCPKCQSKKLTPQLSVFAVSAKGSSSSASAPSTSACGSCGDPRGPGACSLGDMN